MVPARLRYLASSPAADAAVRIIVVVSVLGSGVALWQNRDLSQCVARYNDANNQRSVVLTEATNDERAAERKADEAQAALFLSPLVNKHPRSRTEYLEVLRLFRAYQDALADQRKERADADVARRVHPIPDPPSEVCG